MSEAPKQIRYPEEPARREREGHKGDYGRVLIIGGSTGMLGAVGLASNAALRAGAGLVTFAAPRPVQPHIATLAPCATSLGLECDEDGFIASGAVGQIREAIEGLKIDILAIGPGMGRTPGALEVVRAVLDWQLPCVMDADALNLLARIDDWPPRRKCPLVLTPHPGEFSRLTGRGVDNIQSYRETAALEAMHIWISDAQTDAPLVLVLKGHGTVVTDLERIYINATGNPGMASGGAGDVLTGTIAGLIGQMEEIFDAACYGVWAHGRCGDLAARDGDEAAVIATDLVDYLAQAMNPGRE